MLDFSREELKGLLAQLERPCVSIYMPIRRESVSPQQQELRLKSLLRKAEEQLSALGSRRLDINSMLAPAHKLVTDSRFWEQPREGLAIFLAPEFFRHYDDTSFVIEFDDLVVVADQFHIKPLLPLLTGNGRYYILALSQV